MLDPRVHQYTWPPCQMHKTGSTSDQRHFEQYRSWDAPKTGLVLTPKWIRQFKYTKWEKQIVLVREKSGWCNAPVTVSVYCFSHEDLGDLTLLAPIPKEYCKRIRDRGREMQSSLITYHDNSYRVKITSKASLFNLWGLMMLMLSARSF